VKEKVTTKVRLTLPY